MNSLVHVLVSPNVTFNRLRERGGWLLPLLGIIVFSMVAVWLQMPLTLRTAEKLLQDKPLPANMTMEQMLNLNMITGTVMSVLLPVLFVFLGALVLMIVNLFIRGNATYMQLAKVALLAYVPWLISGLISGVLIRTMDVASPYDVMLNATVLLPEKHGLLFQLLTLVDPFRIWMLVLAIIGTAVAAEKSKKSVWPWLTAIWLLVSFFSAFFAGQAPAA
ncbi:YIP1 family protein [Paenibacillus athensensis]|uniref:Yip1 domain-containing protein n=1 Tax=Paenibacillus athensensis TaxID=1967502 RepID=A0A4Y8PVG8_9BACL|nr:YIP1 family protein [Paenibacillus athensensis]MCD1258778.1 YIP1 family protein [Paenibacillus athensensis]